jgi:hypothetical protein
MLDPLDNTWACGKMYFACLIRVAKVALSVPED